MSIENVTLLLVIITSIGLLVTIYIHFIQPRLFKPKLIWNYFNNNQSAFKRQIAFEPYPETFDFDEQEVKIFRPGLSVRVKILNNGKKTAKNAIAKIENIVFVDERKNYRNQIFYHPTTVKWSGEPDWRPVDIGPQSHYFLDLFWVKNETKECVFAFNKKRYRNEIQDSILRDMIETNSPAEEIYWNVWVDTNWDRGIPTKFSVNFSVNATYIIMGDNFDPLILIASIKWLNKKWNEPEVNIISI